MGMFAETASMLGATLQDNAPIIGALALLAMVLLSISIRRRARERMGPPTQTARERLQELAEQRGVRDDMEQLLAELQDLARKINAQIDTKFAKLEAAIADADRRIAALDRLIHQQAGGGIDVTVGDETPSGEGPSSPSPPPAAPDTAHARVYELADAGKSPVEIAQATGRTPGEVELILALRRHT